MDGHCNTHTIHEAISFPRGTQPNPTQHVPGNSKKARKRVDKPKSPIADPLPQVILGLLTLGIQIGRDNSRKKPIFPKKVKARRARLVTKLKVPQVLGYPRYQVLHTPQVPLEMIQELFINQNAPSVMELIQT